MAIHTFRVTEYLVKEFTTKEIFNYCFGFSEIDFMFEDWFDRLGIENIDEADLDKFYSVISENYSNKGLPFFDLIFRLYNDEFEDLKHNNNSNSVSAEALLWYHILADLSIEGFSKFPLKELKIEIAQIEDGIIAFPQVSDMEMWGSQYREFLIRLLSNLPNNNSSDFPIVEWFENNNQDFDSPIMNNQIIWGLKEDERIQITDNNSWDNYSNLWWNDLMKKNVEYKAQHNGENWIETLQEYPLEVITVRVLLHNSWFDNIENVIKNNEEFDSKAYFTN